MFDTSKLLGWWVYQKLKKISWCGCYFDTVYEFDRQTDKQLCNNIVQWKTTLPLFHLDSCFFVGFEFCTLSVFIFTFNAFYVFCLIWFMLLRAFDGNSKASSPELHRCLFKSLVLHFDVILLGIFKMHYWQHSQCTFIKQTSCTRMLCYEQLSQSWHYCHCFSLRLHFNDSSAAQLMHLSWITVLQLSNLVGLIIQTIHKCVMNEWG